MQVLPSLPPGPTYHGPAAWAVGAVRRFIASAIKARTSTVRTIILE
jgi:hypothetical protein